MAEEGKSLEEITKLAKLATERMGKLNSDSYGIVLLNSFDFLHSGNFLRFKLVCIKRNPLEYSKTITRLIKVKMSLIRISIKFIKI